MLYRIYYVTVYLFFYNIDFFLIQNYSLSLQQFLKSSTFSEYFSFGLLAALLLTATAINIAIFFYRKKILEAKEELNKEIIGRKQAEEVLLLSQNRLKLLNTI